MNRFRLFTAWLPGRRRATLSLGALAVFTLGILAGSALSGPRVQAASAAPVSPAAVGQAVGTSSPPVPQTTYADVVAQVAPAVVTVRSERAARSEAPVASPFPDDPLFQQFFGSPGGRGRTPSVPRREGALGSGVIVSSDGYILTNHHVVDGAEQIKVDLTDRRTFDAKVIGSDAPSDLAVLKIDAAGLPVARIGNSDRVRVGDVVLAIGNPLGVGQTVTMGIVSAKGRATGLSDGGFEDFLQTDAPINEGNSGGALVNAQGELVGINSQILTPSGGNIGIGFAIPASMAQNVMQQLVRSGVVHRAMLGVTVQPMTSDLSRSLGLQDVRGALVAAVQPGSPAQAAGIERGDVILEVDGTAVTDGNSLRNRIASMEPGTRVEAVIVRDSRRVTLHPVLAELPATRAAAGARADGGAQGRFGLAVEPVTPDMAGRLGLGNARGLVVNEVAPGSPAADAGIRAGDVIEQVNRKPVTSPAELQNVLEAARERPALVLLNRRGNELYVALTPRHS